MMASCNQGGTESTNQALSKSANKGTTMLVTVSMAFLILTGPVAVTFAVTLETRPCAANSDSSHALRQP